MNLPELTTNPCKATPSSACSGKCVMFWTVQSNSDTCAWDPKVARRRPTRRIAGAPAPEQRKVCGRSHEHSNPLPLSVGHCHSPPVTPTTPGGSGCRHRTNGRSNSNGHNLILEQENIMLAFKL